jgi:hypothetical protein
MAAPRDTGPDAWVRYIDGIRRTPPEERLRRALEMSDELREITRDGIRRRHPDWTPAQVQDALEDIMLGKELARRAREGPRVPVP